MSSVPDSPGSEAELPVASDGESSDDTEKERERIREPYFRDAAPSEIVLLGRDLLEQLSDDEANTVQEFFIGLLGTDECLAEEAGVIRYQQKDWFSIVDSWVIARGHTVNELPFTTAEIRLWLPLARAILENPEGSFETYTTKLNNICDNSRTEQLVRKIEELKKRPIITKRMGGWPLRNTKNAPSFDGRDAEELPRFIEDIEGLFVEHKLTTDKEKKEKLTHYASAKVERQWKALPAYADQSTYEEFKAEILADYSEVESLQTGNRRRLEDVVRKYKNLTARNLSELQTYKREFTAEYTLLGNLLSNQTLVELFLSALDLRFKEHVWSALAVVDVTRGELMAGLKEANKAKPDLKFPDENTRRMDDRFEIKKVMAKTVELARQAAPIPGQNNVREETAASAILDSLTPKTESLVLQRLEAQEGMIAQLKDSLLLSQKQQTELLSSLKRGAEAAPAQFQQSQDNGQTDARNTRTSNEAGNGDQERNYDSRRERGFNEGRPSYNRSREDDRPNSYNNNQYGGGGNRDYGQNANGYRRNNSRNDDECRYCGIAGHFVAHCRIRREDEDMGLCQYRNFKIYLPNDEQVMFNPNHPMRKVVMDWHKLEKESGPQSQLFHDPDYQEEYSDEHARLRKTLRELEYECMFGGEHNATSNHARAAAPKPPASKTMTKNDNQEDINYWRSLAMAMVQNQGAAPAMQTRSKANNAPDFQ